MQVVKRGIVLTCEKGDQERLSMASFYSFARAQDIISPEQMEKVRRDRAGRGEEEGGG
jgi:hypothetical protein